jgi:hypothetical protein
MLHKKALGQHLSMEKKIEETEAQVRKDLELGFNWVSFPF